MISFWRRSTRPPAPPPPPPQRSPPLHHQRPPLRLPPLSLVPLLLAQAEVGGTAAGADAGGVTGVAAPVLLAEAPVVVLLDPAGPVAPVGVAGAHQSLLRLEGCPGHPTPTHGRGASRCGRSRLLLEGGVHSTSPRPCSPARLLSPRSPGLHHLSPPSLRPGPGVGTRPRWRSPSAPWD